MQLPFRTIATAARLTDRHLCPKDSVHLRSCNSHNYLDLAGSGQTFDLMLASPDFTGYSLLRSAASSERRGWP